MKRFFYLAFAALAVFACNPEEQPANNGKEEQKPEEQTPATGGYDSITAVLKATTVKTAWAAGDEIMVINVTKEGEDVSAKYVLDSGAGAASGTFKPAAGVTALAKGGSAYYAVYPYNEEMSIASHTTFMFALPAEQSDAAPIFSYAEDAATLEFSSFVGGVKFSLKGSANLSALILEDTNTSNALFGNITYEPAKGKIKITNGAATKYSVKRTFTKLELTGEASDPIIVEVPAGSLATGGSITLYDMNASIVGTVAVPTLTVTAGAVADAGTLEFEAVVPTVDLSLKGTANCYILPDKGNYKFLAAKGNDSALTFDNAYSAEVLWETWCDTLEVIKGSVIDTAYFKDGYVFIETPNPVHAGNALVAVKDEAGAILWSWHIWVPETEIVTSDFGGMAAVGAMDRNLGALVAASTDKIISGKTLGFAYQWGRKDPFLHVGNPEDYIADDSSAKIRATVAGIAVSRLNAEATEDAPGYTIEQSIANPTVFVNKKGDWKDGDQVDDLWDAKKTLYDPCPVGYRVPTNEDLKFFTTDATVGDPADGQFKVTADFEKGVFYAGNPAMVFPIVGYLNYNGSYDKPGKRAKYYYGPCSGQYAPCLYLYEGPVYQYSSGQRRAVAGTIRCVVEAGASE